MFCWSVDICPFAMSAVQKLLNQIQKFVQFVEAKLQEDFEHISRWKNSTSQYFSSHQVVSVVYVYSMYPQTKFSAAKIRRSEKPGRCRVVAHSQFWSKYNLLLADHIENPRVQQVLTYLDYKQLQQLCYKK